VLYNRDTNYFLLTIYLCELHYFQVPDSFWEEKKCNAIENGYEYDDIIVRKEGIKNDDLSVKCWYTCSYGSQCLLRFQLLMYL